MRDPIALAYLLARATDTIADTAEIDSEVRLERLRELAALIQESERPFLAEPFQAFAARQTDAGERALILRLPDCLAWLRASPEEDRAQIRQVLRWINEGQTLDVMRFRNPAELRALETAAELDRYTYLVAGSVGEFWTAICFQHLPQFSHETSATMQSWGVAYGKGLQLINILRDAGGDLRGGRCYLPAEELRAAGLAPEDLHGAPAAVEPVLQVWRERAEKGMEAGVEYACAIRPWRVRLATVLPALIGARTLALLRAAGPQAFERRVKMERAEVRGILFGLVSRLASPAAIREMFARLRAAPR